MTVVCKQCGAEFERNPEETYKEFCSPACYHKYKAQISYLGFHTYIASNGEPIRRLKNQNKRNAQKKFVRMARLVVAGKLSMEKFQTSYNSWKNHISRGNCYRLGKDMDERINNILQAAGEIGGNYGKHKSIPM